MEVRIGITQVPRELEIDLGDKADSDAIIKNIEKLIESGDGVLWLTDRKDKRIGIPVPKIAYVEVVSDTEGHKVGFGVAGAKGSK